MPAQVNVTALGKKMAGMFGADHAKAARDTSTPEFNASLPEGIENGVAQIISCTVGEVGPGKKLSGQPYFQMRAAVRHPKTHAGQNVEGRQESLLEMLCDTPESGGRKTRKEHLEHVYAYLRLWGVDTSKGAGLTGEAAFKWFMSVLDALGKAKPLISFRTWKGRPTEQYPNPRVNVSWGGLAKLADDAEVPGDAVNDGSGDTPADVPSDDAPADDTGAGDDGTVETDVDYDALAEAADGGDTDAAERLADLANAVGIDDKAQEKAADYKALAEWIKAGGVPEDAAAGPSVGDVVKYRFVPGPGKKPVTVEAEIKKLYEKNGKAVADLLNNVNKKDKYGAVPVEKLEAF